MLCKSFTRHYQRNGSYQHRQREFLRTGRQFQVAGICEAGLGHGAPMWMRVSGRRSPAAEPMPAPDNTSFITKAGRMNVADTPVFTVYFVLSGRIANGLPAPPARATAVAIAAENAGWVFGIKQQIHHLPRTAGENFGNAAASACPLAGTPLAKYRLDLRNEVPDYKVCPPDRLGEPQGRTELSQSGLITDSHKEFA